MGKRRDMGRLIGRRGFPAAVLAMLACGSSRVAAPDAREADAPPPSASGGITSPASTGGTVSLGGTTSAGGDPRTGGSAQPTGGSVATGGATKTGGASTTGGVVTTGGPPATGGSTATGGGMDGGAVTRTGGIITGGLAATGGVPATGGTATTGGAPGSLSQIPAPPLSSVETDSFTPSGSTTDIADDSAIYANPTAPELSVVIADNKDTGTGGVGVFDMQGKLLQFRQDGQIGNVDLRPGFPLGGQAIVLVGANNRTNTSLIFWKLDPATQRLSAPISAAIPTISPSYGFCLYHSAKTGKFYAFVTQETGKSVMEQYELGESAGQVTGTKVRSFEVGSITEGCVADDELGRLYVAQEDVALWRYGAEPTEGSTRAAVATVGDGHVVADLEGVALAKGPGNSGYLVLSIQSESRFVTYDRETNAYLKGFTVGASGGIDSVSQTNGLDISTANLGPGFPKGALVVHDGANTGGNTSNLKFIPLQ